MIEVNLGKDVTTGAIYMYTGGKLAACINRLVDSPPVLLIPVVVHLELLRSSEKNKMALTG